MRPHTPHKARGGGRENQVVDNSRGHPKETNQTEWIWGSCTLSLRGQAASGRRKVIHYRRMPALWLTVGPETLGPLQAGV